MRSFSHDLQVFPGSDSLSRGYLLPTIWPSDIQGRAKSTAVKSVTNNQESPTVLTGPVKDQRLDSPPLT